MQTQGSYFYIYLQLQILSEKKIAVNRFVMGQVH
jgi:hypothetical protein